MTGRADDALRQRIVAEASGWIGTPYRHQGSRRGVTCDCLGLVRGVWRAVIGAEPEAIPHYGTGDVDDDGLLAALTRHCRQAEGAHGLPGQIIVFRWKRDLPARHLAIAVSPAEFVHAYERSGVLMTRLVPAWERRIAARFDFPIPSTKD